MANQRTSRLLRFPLLWAVLACISGPLRALQIVQIAQLPQTLNNNFPCGDADHNGRYEIFGARSQMPDSLTAFECLPNGKFQRITTSRITWPVFAFGDGDNDGLAEVVGGPGASATICESPDSNSFPTDSIWGVHPEPVANCPWPRFMDLDRDGHRELAMSVYGYGIFLYENTGNNQYGLSAILSAPEGGPDGDFDVGDLDGDSLTELVSGSYRSVLYVFEATGQDNQYVLSARCSVEAHRNVNVAVAHDMDHNGRPEFISDGTWQNVVRLVIFEAAGHAQYHCVWDQIRYDFYPGDNGNMISVGDVDGDGSEEFAVYTGWGMALFKCTGPASYSEVWQRDSTGPYERLFDINRDGRAEIIFDGPRGTEIWEDTEGLGVAEFAKFPLESQVMAKPSIARLGASLQLSGVPPDAEIEILGLDGRLVTRTGRMRQSNWTWNLRNQAGSLVPAGTYFAVIRSRGKSTSLKLCLVK